MFDRHSFSGRPSMVKVLGYPLIWSSLEAGLVQIVRTPWRQQIQPS